MGQLLLGQPIGSAALNALVDGAKCAHGTIIQVDLVSLQPDLNAVWASPSASVADQETLDALYQLFQAFDLSLSRVPGGQMYVSIPQTPDVVFSPLWQVQGVSLDELMPRGPDAKPWVSLISESQILLHQLKSNGAKTGGDSIWPWGMGRMPDPTTLTPRLDSVVASQPELMNLSQWLGVEALTASHSVRPVAGQLTEWLGEPGIGADEHLIRLNAVIMSLMRRLRWGRLKEVELATQTRRWVLSTAQVWKSLG